MIKPINKDTFFLSLKSKAADESDIAVSDDLLDTLKANAEGCVGMAANMIGVNKRIIAFFDGDKYNEMFNPEILKAEISFETEEGCLSLTGTRPVKRYKTIKVKYQTRRFEWRIKTFSGFTAQIIQHEIDHLNGKII